MLGSISNLSIRTKITSAFAVVILLIAALGTTSIQRASATNAVVRDMVSDSVDSLGFLDEMRADLLRFRVYLTREALPGTDPALMQDLETKLEGLSDSYRAADAKYAATVSPGEEADLYAKIKDSSAAYFAHAGEVRSLIHAGKLDEAAKLMPALGEEAEKFDVVVHDDYVLNDKGAADSADAANAAYEQGRIMVLAFIVAAVIIALGFGIFLVTSIARPIKAMTDAMRRLAAKDTSVAVPARDRQDEVGQMAQAVEVFKQNMIETDRLRGEQEALKVRAAADQKALLHKMADGFESKVGGAVKLLASGATELTSTAKILTNAADQSNRQATIVASAAEEASAGVQTVASAAEELSASIGEISRQVAQSAKMTAKAVADAQRTDSMVRALSDGAQKIGAVVELITNIAGQTNLLALNATIEAARAGDAGKGFAVVASEVKNLATQTAKATEEISGQIQQIQNATKDAVEAIRGITGTIDQISQTATTIASAVEEQGAATGEIARNVQQTSQATSQVTQTMSGVSQAAGETGSAAGQVLHVATDVSKQAEMLSAEVRSFLAEVRAA